jgi:hypothetical protein
MVPLHFDMAMRRAGLGPVALVTVQLNQGNGDIPTAGRGEHPAPRADPQGRRRPGLGAIQKWYYEQFADLLRKMDSIKEGNGTLLDNTMVVIGNEFRQRHGPRHRSLAGVHCWQLQRAVQDRPLRELPDAVGWPAGPERRARAEQKPLPRNS